MSDLSSRGSTDPKNPSESSQTDAAPCVCIAVEGETRHGLDHAGPTTHHEAQQEALKILQVFLSDACDAAKKYQFSN